MNDQETQQLVSDAACFKYLQNAPVIEAQAYFWNYSGRKERKKAILERALAQTELPIT